MCINTSAIVNVCMCIHVYMCMCIHASLYVCIHNANPYHITAFYIEVGVSTNARVNPNVHIIIHLIANVDVNIYDCIELIINLISDTCTGIYINTNIGTDIQLVLATPSIPILILCKALSNQMNHIVLHYILFYRIAP